MEKGEMSRDAQAICKQLTAVTNPILGRLIEIEEILRRQERLFQEALKPKQRN